MLVYQRVIINPGLPGAATAMPRLQHLSFGFVASEGHVEQRLCRSLSQLFQLRALRQHAYQKRTFLGGDSWGSVVGICWDLLGFVGIYWDVLGLLGWVVIGDTVDYHAYNGFLMGHYGKIIYRWGYNENVMSI